MYVERVRSLLSEGGITGENSALLAEECKDWFEDQPAVSTYVLLCLFRSLANVWDDEQGGSTRVDLAARHKMLSVLSNVLDQILTGDHSKTYAALEEAAKAFRDSCNASRGADSKR
jgi:hypothetical protein